MKCLYLIVNFDDTTFLSKYDRNALNRVLETLKQFHKISGLNLNIEKTKVVQLVKGAAG